MQRVKLFLFAALAALAFLALASLNQNCPATLLPLGGTRSTVLVASPGSEETILDFISSANRSLDVMLYQFSYPPFKAALAEAARRGVAVRLILDPKIDANLETASFLAANGVAVRFASQEFASTHAKAAAVDSKCLLAGSINWSRHAVQENREIAVIDCSETAAEFEKLFGEDWAEATQVS